MSEYNQRQYRLMLDEINRYEREKVNLDRLVNALEGLLNVLERVPESWRIAFLSEWGKLEDARAVAKFQQTEPNDESIRRTLEAVSRLKLMVLNEMEDVHDRP